MASEAPDDEELVRRFRRGAPHALDTLVARYVRRAIGVAREYTLDLDEAEDVAQEAFTRAVRSLDRFDDRQRFAPWFFTILRNVGRNARRDVRRNEPLDTAHHLPSSHSAGAAAVDAELRMKIDAELAAMPATQASCFRLCEMEGFSAQEVSDMMGIAPPTVRTHAHRARLKLRAALRALGYEAPE